MSNNPNIPWPELPTAAWRETCETLQLWTQIVGKIRLAESPWLNHSWHIALYVTPRGLTTSPIPDGAAQLPDRLRFHRSSPCLISTSDGARAATWRWPGNPSRASTQARMQRWPNSALPLTIDEMPNELPEPIRFSQDHRHASYDPDAVRRFLQILVNCDRVFKQFRTGFLGKASPVHFFWGSFDLAVTRFSGRRAPRHPGGVPHLPDAVACEAYSHEVSSAGFWPGGGAIDYPAFYSYAYPEPAGFRAAKVRPTRRSSARRSANSSCPTMPCARLPIRTGRCSTSCKARYEAAANSAKWDRDALECDLGRPRRGAAGLNPERRCESVPQRLDDGLPDFRAAVGAFIGEVDLRHAPVRFDFADKHRKSDAARADDEGWLGVVLMVDVGWHVGSPQEEPEAFTSRP